MRMVLEKFAYICALFSTAFHAGSGMYSLSGSPTQAVIALTSSGSSEVDNDEIWGGKNSPRRRDRSPKQRRSFMTTEFLRTIQPLFRDVIILSGRNSASRASFVSRTAFSRVASIRASADTTR